MWIESVRLFDNGSIDDANQVAKRLSNLDPYGSRFLLGQYAIYAALADNKDLSNGMASVYSNLIDLGDRTNQGFSAFNIIAQTFSVRLLKGQPAAASFFANECDRLMHMNSEDCFKVLALSVGADYFKDHSRFYAVFSYELFKVGDELKLTNDPSARFYMSMALLKINNHQADLLLSGLRADGLFDASMSRQYCVYMKRERQDFECSK